MIKLIIKTTVYNWVHLHPMMRSTKVLIVLRFERYWGEAKKLRNGLPQMFYHGDTKQLISKYL